MADTTTPAPKPSRRGRPPAAEVGERKARLLDTAAAVFIEAGFAGATMANIARRGGCSLETLYKLYPTKADLFSEVLGRRCRAFFDTLGSLSEDLSLEEGLLHYAKQMLFILMKENNDDIYRIIIAEQNSFPMLGQLLWERGPNRAFRILSEFLSKKAAQDKLNITNPRRASEIFNSLIIFGADMRNCLGVTTDFEEPRDVEKWPVYVTNLFLAMIKSGLL